MEHMSEMDDQGLDRLLAQVAPPPVPASLARRILADFDRIAARPSPARLLRRAVEAIWPGAPAWQPAGAFALALLIGLGVAAFAPLGPSESDDGAASLFADLDTGLGS